MSIKEQIMTIAVSDPSYKTTIEQMKRQLANTNIVAEDLVEAIKMLELIIEDPRKYPEIRQAAIADGLIDEDMFPPEFDKSIIISLLIVLYGMQDSLVQEGYARGGLKVASKQLGHMGQGGDSMLAHINPREAEVLRRMGGQGTVNPNTGLQEYKGLKNILKVALPIALSFALPGLGTAIGAAIGLSGTAAAVAGGALLGGATSFATGGDPLLGFITGGFGGFAQGADGLSSFLSNAAPDLASSIGQTGTDMLARGALGAASGAARASLTGGNVGVNALVGGVGGVVAPMISKASTSVINGLKGSINGLPNAFDASNTGFSGMSDNYFSEAGSPVADSFVDTNINTYDFMASDPSMASYSNNELLGGSNLDPISNEPPEMFSNTFYSVADDGTLINPQMNVETGLGPNADLMYGNVNNSPGNPAFANDLKNVNYPNPNDVENSLNKLAARKQSYNSPGNPALGNAPNNVNYPNPNNSTSIPTPAVSKADALSNMNAIEGSMAEGMLSKFISSDAVKIGGITALLASMDGGSDKNVDQPKLTKAQEEYFNRTLATWDWSKIQAMANAKGTSVTEFITNDKFQSEANRGMFNQKSNYVTPRSLVSQRYARGGLSAIPGYATGSGDGRDDLINARLSDGEYVIDAESVSMLGNGSNKAGASMLNQMRKNLRSHKGKALADGRFSPDAKSPLEYMKRIA